ncbi:phytanoyl-CoA dioxygenase family protein [Candidatus Viadribacter manganicus]|uniref:phytanoyl-CoA dioxygenase family protein n=1 Tax=Candidatus Viadribacter manganicus TaxID=1759059 RepID=UPI00082F89B5|nr:phytanoyl-CoA dioxygenase family protein [Candidatus Viadribacter manganicus]
MSQSVHEFALCPDLAALERDGFVILEDAMAVDELAALKDELEPWLQRTPRCEGDFHGWSTTRVNGLLSKSPTVQRLALHPRLLALAEAALAPACDCIRLNLTQAIRIHPGQRAQAPHRDQEMWPADSKGQIWSLNVMWAVSDFTVANGATRLWPGSHRQAVARDIDPGRAVQAQMTAGSALVYLGTLMHSGGANCSLVDRTGIVVGYCAGWLRTYEEQFLAYPPNIARAFPEPLQRLIGYQWHRPNLGNWEGQDPIAVLQNGQSCAAHRDALPPAIEAELKALVDAGKL